MSAPGMDCMELLLEAMRCWNEVQDTFDQGRGL